MMLLIQETSSETGLYSAYDFWLAVTLTHILLSINLIQQSVYEAQKVLPPRMHNNNLIALTSTNSRTHTL